LYAACSTDLAALIDGILVFVISIVVADPDAWGVVSEDKFFEAKHTARAIAALVTREVLNQVLAWE
jgi:hypothetical protein